jgi:hypothetical protein
MAIRNILKHNGYDLRISEKEISCAREFIKARDGKVEVFYPCLVKIAKQILTFRKIPYEENWI